MDMPPVNGRGRAAAALPHAFYERLRVRFALRAAPSFSRPHASVLVQAGQQQQQAAGTARLAAHGSRLSLDDQRLDGRSRSPSWPRGSRSGIIHGGLVTARLSVLTMASGPRARAWRAGADPVRPAAWPYLLSLRLHPPPWPHRPRGDDRLPQRARELAVRTDGIARSLAAVAER